MQCALCSILKFDLIIIHKFKLLLFTDKKLKIDVKLNGIINIILIKIEIFNYHIWGFGFGIWPTSPIPILS